MCQAYEGERNYLMQKDAKDARATLSAMQEDARRLARYDEAIRLLREAQGEILEGVDMDESQAACDIQTFLAAEGKVAG